MGVGEDRLIVLAECPWSESICAEGEETGESVCCALWAHDKLTPVKLVPPLQLAWQKTPKLVLTSSMLNNNTMWEERSE